MRSYRQEKTVASREPSFTRAALFVWVLVVTLLGAAIFGGVGVEFGIDFFSVLRFHLNLNP